MSSDGLAPDEALRFDDVRKRYRLGPGGTWAGDLREETRIWLRRLLGRAGPPPVVDALAGVSFSVPRGGNVALVGANGAGKSTALRLVAGITVPTRGLVQVRGRVASLIQIGAGFHRELTGRENVFLYGAILGLSRSEIRRRYGAITAFAGLERFMETPVKRYSQGMHVRLGFSVAVHADADVLLVDEVIAVGDRAFRERCFDRMQSLLRGGTTLLFVSHERALVEATCERALLLEEGRVVADGPAARVWDDYEARAPRGTGARRTRTDGAPSVVITALEATDGRGRRVAHGVEGEPLRLRVGYRVETCVEGFAIQVTIRRGAQLLFSSSSASAGVVLPADEGAEGTAELVLGRLALLPGEYVLRVETRAGPPGRTAAGDAWETGLLVEGAAGLGEGLVSLRPSWELPP